MDKPHGWFAIPGVQTGEREIKERVAPLKPLIPYTKGATVLDLGCAEGLIGKWFLDHGAAKLHGLEKFEPWVDMARRITEGRPATFDAVDFNHFDLATLPRFDIVLCLNIAQKLFDPRAFILEASRRAEKFFVYSGPAIVLKDPRSGNVPIDVADVLATKFKQIHFDAGFKHKRKGHFGVRMIFKRKKRRVK